MRSSSITFESRITRVNLTQRNLKMSGASRLFGSASIMMMTRRDLAPIPCSGQSFTFYTCHFELPAGAIEPSEGTYSVPCQSMNRHRQKALSSRQQWIFENLYVNPASKTSVLCRQDICDTDNSTVKPKIMQGFFCISLATEAFSSGRQVYKNNLFWKTIDLEASWRLIGRSKELSDSSPNGSELIKRTFRLLCCGHSFLREVYCIEKDDQSQQSVGVAYIVQRISRRYTHHAKQTEAASLLATVPRELQPYETFRFSFTRPTDCSLEWTSWWDSTCEVALWKLSDTQRRMFVSFMQEIWTNFAVWFAENGGLRPAITHGAVTIPTPQKYPLRCGILPEDKRALELLTAHLLRRPFIKLTFPRRYALPQTPVAIDVPHWTGGTYCGVVSRNLFGTGTFRFNEVRYDGEWYQALPNGTGKLAMYSDRSHQTEVWSYEGSFVRGQLHGRGKESRYDQATKLTVVVEGEWQSGIQVVTFASYQVPQQQQVSRPDALEDMSTFKKDLNEVFESLEASHLFSEDVVLSSVPDLNLSAPSLLNP